jgi:hypothetical protein
MDRQKLPLPRAGRQVPVERTGWRDQNLSARHRTWGIGCPAIDIDLILIEMNRAKPVAIIEYKGELAQPQLINHPSYLALCDLGNRARLAVFAVRYAHDFSWFRVVPLNHFSKCIMPTRQMMNERQYVTLLYNLRGVQPPASIFESIETAI